MHDGELPLKTASAGQKGTHMHRAKNFCEYFCYLLWPWVSALQGVALVSRQERR